MYTYLDDLRADFRVFYRIDDIEEMDSVTFLRLAYRVGAYQGVIAARAAREIEEQDSSPTTSNGEKTIESTEGTFVANDLSHLVDFVQV